MEIISQFLYRGTYTDYENTFQRKVETPVEVHLPSTKGVAVLRSKEWFPLDISPWPCAASSIFGRLLDWPFAFAGPTVGNWNGCFGGLSCARSGGAVLAKRPSSCIITRIPSRMITHIFASGDEPTKKLFNNSNSSRKPYSFKGSCARRKWRQKRTADCRPASTASFHLSHKKCWKVRRFIEEEG